MEKDNIDKTASEQAGAEGPSSAAGKKAWEPPKLAFVKPTLRKHGTLTEVTGSERDGFFGGFTT